MGLTHMDIKKKIILLEINLYQTLFLDMIVLSCTEEASLMNWTGKMF